MLPCVPLRWLVGFAPLSVQGQQLQHQQLRMGSVWCVGGALCPTCLARNEVLLSLFEFLLSGTKGGLTSLPFPWWWAASGSSSVPSSFCVARNKMSSGLSKSTILVGRVLPPRVSAVLRALSLQAPIRERRQRYRWGWRSGGCPLCSRAEQSR